MRGKIHLGPQVQTEYGTYLVLGLPNNYDLCKPQRDFSEKKMIIFLYSFSCTRQCFCGFECRKSGSFYNTILKVPHILHCIQSSTGIYMHRS